MPPPATFPGVYVEEIPSGSRTITGVATSITAFVGRAGRGVTETPVIVTSFGDFERLFGGLWAESSMGFSVRDFFRNGGSTAIIVRLYRPDSGAGAKPAKATLEVDTLALEATSEGAWGNSLRARVDHGTRAPNAARGETATSLFNLFVHDDATGVEEAHRDLVVAPSDHPRLVTRVLENESMLVRATATGADRPAETAAQPTQAGLASDGQVLDAESFTAGGSAQQRGLFALEKADLLNLLVLPPYRSNGSVDPAVVAAAASYCEKRRAMLLLDSPPEWNTVGKVTTAHASSFDAQLGTSSPNAAVYFPRLREPNPLKGGQVEEFSAAGAVAGVFARTDAQRGVWKAPAGVEATIAGSPGLNVALNDLQNGQVNGLGVNCLRTFPLGGTAVWGSRTLQGADGLNSEWKYVPVRRLALHIEESLDRGTRWAVFEPNGEPLWAQIRLNVGAFLNSLFQQGAFKGNVPKDGYFVKCDADTTTQADRDQGLVNIVVGFAPLKPAEFVVIRVQQRAVRQP